MKHTAPPGRVLAEETGFDSDADPVGLASPVSQDEIDDIALDEGRPIEDRIARLIELRGAYPTTPNFVTGDAPGPDGIDEAVARLRQRAQFDRDTADLERLDGALSFDPDDRLDSLSPDDEDGRQAIEGDP